MDIEQFRVAGYAAIDAICARFYALESQKVAPSHGLKPGYLRNMIPDSAPDIGQSFQDIADDFKNLILPGITNWAHPSFFAYFPTANTFEGILGDLYASSISNPGFNWSSSPACTELEIIVMDWAARLLGLSDVFLNSSGIGGGCLQVTASDSALIAVVAARKSHLDRHPNTRIEDLVIYTTTQTHSLGKKAGMVLGIPVRDLQVTAQDRFALRGSTLRSALEEDTANGRSPFILIATIGTTSSGAVDNLPEIKQVVKDYPSLKIHVDAAWAGVALSCPELRKTCYLDEVNEIADFFCTNFHKWGLVNFDASTLWVRDRKSFTDAFDITPTFLKTINVEAEQLVDFRNWHFGLGRRFRSLKMYFVLRSYGAEGFRANIRKAIKLNNIFSDLVSGSPVLRIVTPPSFSLTVFRIDPKREEGQHPLSNDDLNQLNETLFLALCERQDILLTQTHLNETFCIRFAVGSTRTEEEHILKAFDIVATSSKLVLEAFERGRE